MSPTRLPCQRRRPRSVAGRASAAVSWRRPSPRRQRRRARRSARPRNRCPAPAPEAPPAGGRTSRGARRTPSRRGARRPGRRRESRARRADGWRRSATPAARGRAAREARTSAARRAGPACGRLRGGADTGVTSMPSMIGRSQSAYRGPYSSITVPAASTRNRFPPARAMPIGTRSRISTTIVPGSRRRSVASATHADAKSLARQRSRSTASRPWPVSPSSRAATSPACTRWLPITWMCCTVKPREVDSGRRGPEAGAREQARQRRHLDDAPQRPRARVPPPGGEHRAAAEAAIGRRGDGHVSSALSRG